MHDDRPVRPRGAYPAMKVAGGLAYVSGTSSRLADNSIAGAEVDELGTRSLDIGIQTSAVLANIERTLRTNGMDRTDLVDTTVFLVSINDFGGYNQAWAEFFEGCDPPARTTVAVHQLPHPHLLIEIKATAVLRQNSIEEDIGGNK